MKRGRHYQFDAPKHRVLPWEIEEGRLELLFLAFRTPEMRNRLYQRLLCISVQYRGEGLTHRIKDIHVNSNDDSEVTGR